MYQPKHFNEPRPEALHALMRGHPLATLVATTGDAAAPGLDANLVPLLLSPGATPNAPHGILRGHVARANPLWQGAQGREVIALFHGPQGYVSPSWYPSKLEDGRAVPTWNYAVAQARGHLHVFDDAAWLRTLLRDLTQTHEQGLPEPWSMDDAPADYIERLAGAVVGIEIHITQLTGKFKLSQNQRPDNQQGVLAGLRARQQGQDAALADLMASYFTSPT